LSDDDFVECDGCCRHGEKVYHYRPKPDEPPQTDWDRLILGHLKQMIQAAETKILANIRRELDRRGMGCATVLCD
jgi:hypothetical protein